MGPLGKKTCARLQHNLLACDYLRFGSEYFVQINALLTGTCADFSWHFT